MAFYGVYGFPRSSAPEQSFQNKRFMGFGSCTCTPSSDFYSSGAASGALLILPRDNGTGFISQAPLMPEIYDEIRQDGTEKQRRQRSLVIPPNRWGLGSL